jgi:hypothetical protein
MTSKKKRAYSEIAGGKCYHGVYSPPINLTHWLGEWQYISPEPGI